MNSRPAITFMAAIPICNGLGENALWDVAAQALWWTDIDACCLYRFAWPSGVLKQFHTPERLCSFGFVEKSSSLIAAFESGFAIYDPDSGVINWLYKLSKSAVPIRLNDGRVDRQGRFWAGTMEERPPRKGLGKLYCLDRSGRLNMRESGIGISNGLCWSPCSKHMYFADSSKRTIFCYEFRPTKGEIANRQDFALTQEGLIPDGATVDRDGGIWSAQWGGSCVIRYRESGEIDHILQTPVSQPTCISFGGKNLDLLFVTSAANYLDPQTRARETKAGQVLVYRTSFAGLPEPRFRISAGAVRAFAGKHLQIE